MRRTLALGCLPLALLALVALGGFIAVKLGDGRGRQRPAKAGPPGYVHCRGGRLAPGQLVGLSLARAEHQAQTQGCVIRVTLLDGSRRANAPEALSYRIDVASEGGVVTRVLGLG